MYPLRPPNLRTEKHDDQGAGKRRGEDTLNSFLETEHVLDGIHDGRIAVFVAIVVKLLLMLFDCLGSMTVLLRLAL